MPIPTADIYDREQQQQQQNGHTSPSDADTTSSGASSARTDRSDTGYQSSSATELSDSGESERTLTREEADRLYEERMEEQYAMREGGA